MPTGMQLAVWLAIVAAACFFGGLGLLAQWRDARALKRWDRALKRRERARREWMDRHWHDPDR